MFFPLDPNHFAPTDVRSKNAQLVKRLRTSISLETMKHALENKDRELVLAQKEARTKTKLAEKKLALIDKLEEEIKALKASTASTAADNEGVEEEEAALMCMKQSGINVLLISSSLYEDAHRMGTYIGLAFAPFKYLKIA